MTDLIDQFQSIKQQLTEEKRSHQARIALIDKVLAGQAPVPKKEAPKPREGTLTDAIMQVAASGPLTVKQYQEALPSYPGKSVDATVRQLAAGGKLTKDESSPRRFGLATAVLRAV